MLDRGKLRRDGGDTKDSVAYEEVVVACGSHGAWLRRVLLVDEVDARRLVGSNHPGWTVAAVQDDKDYCYETNQGR